MESVNFWILFSVLHLLLSTGQSTAQGTDNGGLGVVPELVFKIQQIFIEHDCQYEDRKGICSTGVHPHCSDVKNSGVCILNSCPRLSEPNREKLAGLLAQIGAVSHEICGLTKEDLLKAAKARQQPKNQATALNLSLATLISLLFSTIQWRYT